MGWSELNMFLWWLFKPFQGIILRESDVFRRSQVQLPRRRTRPRRVWISTWRLPATSTPTCCCCCEMRLCRNGGKRTAATRWTGGPHLEAFWPQNIFRSVAYVGDIPNWCWWNMHFRWLNPRFCWYKNIPDFCWSKNLLIYVDFFFILIFHDISWYFMIFHDISWYFHIFLDEHGHVFRSPNPQPVPSHHLQVPEDEQDERSVSRILSSFTFLSLHHTFNQVRWMLGVGTGLRILRLGDAWMVWRLFSRNEHDSFSRVPGFHCQQIFRVFLFSTKHGFRKWVGPCFAKYIPSGNLT